MIEFKALDKIFYMISSFKDKVRRFWTWFTGLHWLAIGGLSYWTMLAMQLWVSCPDYSSLDVAAPYFASTTLMLVFGPYLFVADLCEAWTHDGCWWMLKIAPVFLIHLALVSAFLTRILRRVPHRIGIRRIALAGAALVSGFGIWSEVPEVTTVAFSHDAVVSPVRLTVVSDLHSCRYGANMCSLIAAVRETKPDAVLLVGDIFDDRLDDSNTRAFVRGIARDLPCYYVTGNHEFWSDRVFEMKDWLRAAGVTVLEGACVRTTVGKTPLLIGGVDDPTYLYEMWDRQLETVQTQSSREGVRILLSHRPERVAAYQKLAGSFDLVISGHSHAGQWRLPLCDRGVAAPDQGFFPRYIGGFYPLADGVTMLVSRGLARESSPFPRYFNHPEVVVLDLKPRI